jgi:hypothetical protein
MRHIHLEDGLRLRFPARDEEFNLGVEIGMLAALMNAGVGEFTRWIATSNLDQVRALAEGMNYHLVVGPSDAAFSRATLRAGCARPKLRLVHAMAEAVGLSARRASLALAQ